MVNSKDVVDDVMGTLVFRVHTWRFKYLQKGTESLETRVHMTNLTRSNSNKIHSQGHCLLVYYSEILDSVVPYNFASLKVHEQENKMQT